jgi:hydroxymethylpyrimidine/phosphomethylpyrimidine kinase
VPLAIRVVDPVLIAKAGRQWARPSIDQELGHIAHGRD